MKAKDVLRHPSDVEGLRYFDCKFPDFSSDSWNVRLELASDLFNPFSHMSTSYSLWPVVLISYNFSS